MYESTDKMVSHPSHYQSETGLEVIDVIESFTFDLKGIEATDTGNVLKYMCRWKNKNGLQDLEKAKWYLDHLIDHVRLLEEKNTPINDDTEDAIYSEMEKDLSSWLEQESSKYNLDADHLAALFTSVIFGANKRKEKESK